MPRTTLGKWSVFLVIVTPIFFLLGNFFLNLFYDSVSAGDTLLEDITYRPGLAIAMLTGMISGVMSFPIGVLAIVRNKERSLWVYISTSLGAFLTLFLLGEVFLSH